MNLVELLGESAFADRNEIAIRKRYDQFGDDPSKLRWRAVWDKDWEGDVIGILLNCYPVIKETAQGAWIDPNAYHHGEWVTHDIFKRWVSNSGGQAWAKPTQEDALNSLTIRYKRWSKRIINDANYYISASRALRFLMPEKEKMVADSLAEFSRFVQGMAK